MGYPCQSTHFNQVYGGKHQWNCHSVNTQKLESFSSDEIIIGLESTAHYGNNLVEFLVKRKYKVCVINPIQTNTMRKNNIRKAKADKIDTFTIAKTFMMNPHRIFTMQDISIMHLKDLGRFRMELIEKRTQAKIQLTSYVDQAFPELQYFLKFGIHQKSVYAVYQSGNFRASHTKMSKRSSRPLRYALINATHNVVRNNKTFKDYYNQKISMGKSHYNTLSHCAGKLVRIIYKMLTDNAEFKLD